MAILLLPLASPVISLERKMQLRAWGKLSLFNEPLRSECTPPVHPDRPISLVNLANCFHERFQSQGTKGNLDEAIELSHVALVFLTLGHVDRVSAQDRLTAYLKTKM